MSAPLRKGFTMIELLIVMGMLGIISAVAVAAINPKKQICETENAKRHVTEREFANAVNQYYIKTGDLPNTDAIPIGSDNAKPICRLGIVGDDACVNLDQLVPDYIITVPVEFIETNEHFSGYTIYKKLGGPASVNSDYIADCHNL